MILQNLDRFKVNFTKSKISSFAGLPLVAALAKNTGLLKSIDKQILLKIRDRGYSVSKKILSLILMLTAGGECLDDMRLLNADQGLKNILQERNLPASNTLGEFLRQFTNTIIYKLSDINIKFIRKVIQKSKLKTVTVDVDASLIESYKKQAARTYEGFYGYNPLMGFIAELSLAFGMFRPGNSSPRSNAFTFIKRIHKKLGPIVDKISIRSDSAWYTFKVLDYCQKHNIDFTVTADKDAAVKRLIKNTPESDWTKFDDQEITETVHTGNKAKFAYKLILLRKKVDQPDLFQGPYRYYAVITNINDKTPAEIIRWHRKRANCENMIKELKHGFAVNKLPCASIKANAAFFQINLMAFNLMSAFKILLLPQDWSKFNIKNLRYRFINIPGLIVNHARDIILKIPDQYPFADIFQQARGRIHAIAAEW